MVQTLQNKSVKAVAAPLFECAAISQKEKQSLLSRKSDMQASGCSQLDRHVLLGSVPVHSQEMATQSAEREAGPPDNLAFLQSLLMTLASGSLTQRAPSP